MKIFTINGNNCSDLTTFYDEAYRVLCPGFAAGHGLDSLSDVLAGGLSEAGGLEYRVPAHIIWKHADKSRQELGESDFEAITELIKQQGHQLSLA